MRIKGSVRKSGRRGRNNKKRRNKRNAIAKASRWRNRR